jgi:hypothetical protein
MMVSDALPGLFGDKPNQHSTSELRGLVAACLDGLVESFEYRDLRVVSNTETFELLYKGRGVGRLRVVGDDIEGVVEWLENKADLYASNNDND